MAMKTHSILDDLNKQLVGIALEQEVTVLGTKFKLTTLTANEDSWATSFANGNSLASLASTTRAPKLAASIKEIGGTPVDKLFVPQTPEDKERYSGSPVEQRQAVVLDLLQWLAEQPQPLIEALWKPFAELNRRQQQSFGELKNS